MTSLQGPMTPAAPVSADGAALANALVGYSKQVKQFSFMRGVRYDAARFAAARARAQSLVEAGAHAAGTTTLDSEDFKQLILAGANLLYRLGINVRITSQLEGAQYRDYERRVRAFSTEFMQEIAELGRQGAASGQLRGLRGRGLGFILIGIALVALGGYLLLMDNGEELATELCRTDPTSPACLAAIEGYHANIQNPTDPFSAAAGDVSEAIASVLKWVGIGAAVLGVGYLLWTFGPGLIGAGRSVRARSKARYARAS